MSLDYIKVAREKIIKIVQENKEKHDIILKDAISGYWESGDAYVKKYEKENLERINKEHREKLKQLRKSKKDAIKTLKTNVKNDTDIIKQQDTTKKLVIWTSKYPEDHSDDYIGTLRKLELCVDKEIELRENEFDSYVRNKWNWKDSFIESNTNYISYNGTLGMGISNPTSKLNIDIRPGSCSSYAVSGSYAALKSF